MSRIHFSLLVSSLTFVFAVGFFGCHAKPEQPVEPLTGSVAQLEETGEELLVRAVDELISISEWSGNPASPLKPADAHPYTLAKKEADSIFVYGEVTSSGYGAVVTERREYPKGILLITIRRSYGRAGRVVSETSRYISYADYLADQPQQSVSTEIIPLSQDTIVTHVVRNGILETFTFRLPVVTRTINQNDQSVRVTSRFGLGGTIVTETTDALGGLIRRTTSSALPSGALETRTDYPDGTWRTVSTLGRADGSILREITTGG